MSPLGCCRHNTVCLRILFVILILLGSGASVLFLSDLIALCTCSPFPWYSISLVLPLAPNLQPVHHPRVISTATLQAFNYTGKHSEWEKNRVDNLEVSWRGASVSALEGARLESLHEGIMTPCRVAVSAPFQ